MVYRGEVKNGVVVLKEGVKLSDGTEVRVEPVSPDERERPRVYERLAELAGKAKDLPSDLARQHDHYLHGRGKQ